MQKSITTLTAIITVMTLSHCAPQNNLQRDAAIGTASGAALGAIIGNNVGDNNAKRGATIGAILGGLGGAAYGNNKDLEQGKGYTFNKNGQQIQQAPPQTYGY